MENVGVGPARREMYYLLDLKNDIVDGEMTLFLFRLERLGGGAESDAELIAEAVGIFPAIAALGPLGDATVAHGCHWRKRTRN